MDTYFTYLVSLSVTLQVSWDEMDQYIPPAWRHGIIGTATAIVIIDRGLKAVKTTKEQ